MSRNITPSENPTGIKNDKTRLNIVSQFFSAVLLAKFIVLMTTIAMRTAAAMKEINVAFPFSPRKMEYKAHKA